MSRIKNAFFVLLTVLMLVLPLGYVSAKTEENGDTAAEKVKIYVFYGDGCPHCAELHEFLDELEADAKYNTKFSVVDYEVWYNEKNEKLMQKVAEHFKDNVSGVPYFVIGEKRFTGFSSDDKTEIKNLIKTLYGSEDYKDIVSTIGTGDVDAEEETDDKDNNLIGIIILGVIVVGVITIIVISNKNKDSEEEITEEIKVVEENKEEPVKEVKKVAPKKAAAKTTTAKKTTKPAAKKTATKKTTTSKTTTKEAAKKTTAKKTVAKKTTSASTKKTTKK